MITRLEVDGFKSLRDFAVDLEPITVFIGPNNAGKSNILEALALLSRLASQSVDEAFRHGRGRPIAQFTRAGGQAGRTMRFAVELLLPPAPDDAAVPNRCRYELVIERRSRPSGAEYLAIQDESLWLLDRASDSWIDAHPELARHVHHAAEKQCVLKQVGESEPLHLIGTETRLSDMIHAPHRYTVMYGWDLNDEPPFSADVWLAACVLSDFYLLHLAPAALRAASDRIGTDTLAADGSNLPTVLASLPAPLIGEIRADMVSVVPGIASFEVVPQGDELHIEFVLSGGERVPAELTSDGTLRILALLAALRLQPRPSIVCVDELENGIHPGRLRQLLELLQETVTLADASDAESPGQLPVQLLMTTHSPVMLEAFRSRLQCLRFVDLVRRERQFMTRARPVAAQAGADRGHLVASLREVDHLLHSADSKMASST